MKKISKVIKGGVLAAFAALVITAPAFAASISDCVGSGRKYENLSTESDDTYSVRCTRVKDGENYVTLYGKSSSDCAQAASLAADPESCNGDELNDVIKTIINTIIFVIGLVAVVMIILGGISYATSQGDAAKVKKGKDTILYGIVGLVIAILAYAIINFVLEMIGN